MLESEEGMAPLIATAGTDLLVRYSDYLAMLGRAQLHDQFEGKIDLSGVVQVTLHEAASSSKMNELTDEEKLAWLRRVFANNLTDEVRRLQADKRDINRERAIEESSARVDAWLAAGHSSPSECAVRNEDLLRLSAALPNLVEAQRQVVEMHYLQGRTLAAIGVELGRSREAIAGLLFRGLCRLRSLLAVDSIELRR